MDMKFRQVFVLSAALLGVLSGAAAIAHHSFAAYDHEVTKKVTGFLKEFEWSAPHSVMTVAYIDDAGKPAEVSVTTGAPAMIAKQGFKPHDFRVGSKVSLSWHPNRSGLDGGEMVAMDLEDGRSLRGDFGPPGGATPPASAAPPSTPPPSN
jgi:hypothetical protein